MDMLIDSSKPTVNHDTTGYLRAVNVNSYHKIDLNVSIN
jgi:hypothetical protein